MNKFLKWYLSLNHSGITFAVESWLKNIGLVIGLLLVIAAAVYFAWVGKSDIVKSKCLADNKPKVVWVGTIRKICFNNLY
ncbi:hypothetical protein SHAb15599_00159 [Acinetobacter phage SH-Ab 15599]|nr:hypothetical protein SHAb15599_00159 [Acinetobacter phage SH-Ab 15599]